MKKPFFLILILFTSCFQFIGICWGATNEGYGEDLSSLGQSIDTFDTSDNITIAVEMIRNATLQAMELNYTAALPAYENFTDYIEVDVNGDITKNVFDIEWDTMRRDADSYVYLDWGAGSWDDFEYDFELNITALEAGDISAGTVTGFCTLANMIGSVDEIRIANKPFLGMQLAQTGDTDGEYFMYIWEEDLVGASTFVLRLQDGGGDYTFDDDIEYYFRFNRSGADVGGYAYSDQARTTLLASREATGDGDNYRYLYPLNNWGKVADGGDHHTGYMENLFMGNTSGGYSAIGYFNTTDYLLNPDANGSALVLLLNSSIPGNTGIQVHFSNDTLIWTDHEGTPLDSNILMGGFESIDLRYLNHSNALYFSFIFSSPNLLFTPRLYQVRLITMIGAATGVGPGPSGSGAIGLIMLILICSPFILLVVWRSKRR